MSPLKIYPLVLLASLVLAQKIAQKEVSYSEFAIGSTKDSVIKLLEDSGVEYGLYPNKKSYIDVGYRNGKVVDITPNESEFRTIWGESLKYHTEFQFTLIEFRDNNGRVKLDFNSNDRLMRIKVDPIIMKAATLRDGLKKKYGPSIAAPDTMGFEYSEVYFKNGVDIIVRWKVNGYVQSVKYVHQSMLQAHWTTEYNRLKAIHDKEMQEKAKSTVDF